MKAVVITRPGASEVLEIQERPDPIAGISQVRVKVVASALNRADISQRFGRYPAPPGYPQDIPGLEFAGIVDAIGEGVSLWENGDHVMGIIGGGAHAEYVVIDERELMRIPSSIDFDQAAAIPEVFLTAYDAMFEQLGLNAYETLLIHAVGSGVGTAAVQMARVAEIRSVGTSRSSDKLDRAQALGLDEAIVVTDSSWPQTVLERTEGRGVNAVLDLVGAEYLAGNLEVLALRGRLVSVGLTAGAKAELDMRVLMRKRLRLIGTVLRSRPIDEKIALVQRFAVAMLPMFDEGRLKPVVDTVFEFEDIRAAHDLMESNRSFGKIVLRWR